MSLRYRKVVRKVLGGDDAGKMKTYAVARSGFCDMKTLCKLIAAHSKMSSADIKSVLDSLNWVMDVQLLSGNIVQLGEFGNFRLTISSEGVEENEAENVKFTAQNIKKARVVFLPGVTLKKSISDVSFEYEKPQEKPVAECDKEHAI